MVLLTSELKMGGKKRQGLYQWFSQWTNIVK